MGSLADKNPKFPRRFCQGTAALFLLATIPAAADTNAAPANTPMMSGGGAMMSSPPPAPAADAGKPVIPPVPEDYFQRYGKILAPGTEPTHPLKLAMPFPDVGQIKIPSQDEINMREKLERLATMSDEDIRINLYKWPAFTKMNLADEGQMLVRIQQFKDRRSHIAQDKARSLGLLTLRPDQMAQFEKDYWDQRLQLDRDLSKQFEPIFKQREAKIGEALFREFSTPDKPGTPPTPAVAQSPKPVTIPPMPPPSTAAPMQMH